MLPRLVGEDVEIVSSRAKTLGMIKADPSSIDQVVMNLVINARDAMPTGGKLTIETVDVVLDEEQARRLGSVRPGRHILLSVTDTGIGMDEVTQSHIFEPFYTTKPKDKGTGLGLSTVFGIVAQSGGNVSVESELGKGTTFKIYLPCEDGLAEIRPPKGGTSSIRGTETILLVEDEDQVRTVARGILKRHGYRVIEARSAGDALLLCQRHPDAIHLLLSDVVMPEMSGPELAKQVAAVRPNTKVLFMSGYTDDSVMRHGILNSDLAFLQKPLTPILLTTKVREVLDSSGTRKS
jgi:two-component system, cell cycle sensor histidine kinase and response regulator CckA